MLDDITRKAALRFFKQHGNDALNAADKLTCHEVRLLFSDYGFHLPQHVDFSALADTFYHEISFLMWGDLLDN